jgi:uncharacterized membrane protein
MFDAVARDAVHPPLFYALLKIWIAIGSESRLWLRLLPLGFSIAAAPVFLALCRAARLTRFQSAIAFLFLAINPYQVFHSQYVRMYSLAFLLSLCSLIAFLRFLDDRSGKFLLPLANALLVYTHYFGWLLIAAELFCAALWRRGKLAAMAAGAGLVALCSAPWALIAWRAAAAKGGLAVNLGWIERPGPGEFVWHFAGLNGPIHPYLMAIALIPGFVSLLIFGLRAAWRDGAARPRIRLLLALALFPPLAAFIGSYITPQSVWGSRYLIIAAGPYFLLLAIALDWLPGAVRRGVIAATLVFAAYGVIQLSLWPEPRVDIESIARQIAAMESQTETRITVYSMDRPLAYTLAYFFETNPHLRAAPIRYTTEVREPKCWIVYTNHSAWREGNPEPGLRSESYRFGGRIVVRDEWNEITAIQLKKEKAAPAGS